MLDVCLLGTGGMMPLPKRYLTSLMCRADGKLLLIDCGEGTQVAIRENGWGFKKIEAILITHYHADHCSGFPGLMMTMADSGRVEPITIIGPPGLEAVCRQLLCIASELPFKIKYLELPFGGRLDLSIPNTDYHIDALLVEHTRATFAYNVRLTRAGKFDLSRAEALNIAKPYWGKLQAGETVNVGGKLYTPDMVLGTTRRGMKVSYCTDTRPTKLLPGFVKGADLFICEGLHGDPEFIEKTRAHMHMMINEAAAIAKAGDVCELWLTHFSPAMPNPFEYLEGAKAIFPNTHMGKDGRVKLLRYEDEIAEAERERHKDKAEIIKDCNRQIHIYELMLEKDPENQALISLLGREKKILDEIKLAN